MVYVANDEAQNIAILQ